LGFVFQRYELLPNLTALENVIVPMMYAGVGRSRRRQRAEYALQRVGLGDRLHKRPGQLSGGQQQRVAIARAIVNRPLVLLADEPTGALDTQSAATIVDIFDQLYASGMTLIVVTHAQEVACYSKRTIMISDGRLLSDQPTVTAMPQQSLR
jgi:putative ABC transport system ATP-binding protein